MRSSNASPDDDKDEIYDIYGNHGSDDGNGEYYENKRISIANKDDSKEDKHDELDRSLGFYEDDNNDDKDDDDDDDTEGNNYIYNIHIYIYTYMHFKKMMVIYVCIYTFTYDYIYVYRFD
jgi:hypothetical protein